MPIPPENDQDPVARLGRIDLRALPPDGGERFNRLIFEKSPYLLQHAENPVDWRPWGEDAFAKARLEQKPVFLSIGYSTCHWCHVMAHESFADETVARILNRHFIAVKVDREERPDIDITYMAACQLMTGSGGWPLTLILTPEKEPVFAATYMPKSSHNGMIGLIAILERISTLWNNDRKNLNQIAAKIRQSLLHLQERSAETQPLSETPLRMASAQYLQNFDRRHAGFGQPPKFPAPHNLSLLLRLAERFDDEKARSMALQTLQQIRLGGIYDQLGYGLHRYSVDERWLLPHFEKMLYDQALASMAYLEAYLVSGDSFYAQTVREIAEYMQRDLCHPDGAFFCGEDADSEGKEGTFYLWTPQEVRENLGEELGLLFCRSFNVTENGHLDGRSILHLPEDVQELADQSGIDAAELAALLAEGRRRLFAARTGRIRPHRDDKVLSGWNGLAIAALARAGAHLGEAAMISAATRAADFILTRLRRGDGRLLRRWRRDDAAIPAFLEDYAFLSWGLTELYLATFDCRHLESARELTDAMLELFAANGGGLFDSGFDAEAPLTRGTSLQDGAIPSGSAVAALNLLRLGRLTGSPELESRGERLIAVALAQVTRYPSAYAQMLIALDYALGPKSEVVLVAGEDPTGLELFLAELRRRFLPRTLILIANPDARRNKLLAPLIEGKMAVAGRTTAWVCTETACLPPVTEVKELHTLLRPGT